MGMLDNNHMHAMNVRLYNGVEERNAARKYQKKMQWLALLVFLVVSVAMGMLYLNTTDVAQLLAAMVLMVCAGGTVGTMAALLVMYGK